MNRSLTRSAAAIILALTVGSACAGGSSTRNRVAFRTFSVEGQAWGGPIEGPWEWSGQVTVASADMTLTCDRLKLWPTKDGRDLERAEASGNIAIRGRYTAADGAEWKILGKAAAVTYESKAGQGVLHGSVNFEATNLATRAVLSVEAEKLTYDVKARTFHFSRGTEPVRLEWQEPKPPASPPPSPEPPDNEGDKG